MPYFGGNATLTNVAGAASSTGLFANNPGANGRAVYNDSSAILYLKFGTSASTTSYTVQIPSQGYFEFPDPLFSGACEGIWSSATGNARVTEW